MFDLNICVHFNPGILGPPKSVLKLQDRESGTELGSP